MIGIYVDNQTAPETLFKTLYFLTANTRIDFETVLLNDRGGAHLPGIPGALSHLRVITVHPGSRGPARILGRAAAFNRLIEQNAQIYVFLDAGVLVTAGWLARTVRALEASPKYGFAGPSSNNCWNEQGIFHDDHPASVDIETRAGEVKEKYNRAVQTTEPLYSLVECCLVFKREAAEAISRADESYGVGYCWEMDLQVRAVRAGFKGIWVKGVYVHRTAANLKADPAREAVFEKNKHRYQEKFCGCFRDNRKDGYRDHCKGDECPGFAREKDIRVQEDAPLVSCVMPTRGRPGYVPQAIKYFLQQDYPERELIIVYEEPSDLPPDYDTRFDDPGIRFVKTPYGSSIGYKRNAGCGEARGDIIAQWDDDDWYSPRRLSIQVQPILENKCDITALYNHLFLELDKQRFWECSSRLYDRMFVEGVAGGTLVYRRRIRGEEECIYPNTSLREDADFMVDAMGRGAVLEKIDGYEHFIYLRHGTNSWSFVSGSFLDPTGWQTVTTPGFFSPDAEFYRLPPPNAAVSPAPPAPGTEAPSKDKKNKPAGMTFGQERTPMVSCIMPTADRREFIIVAIENFLSQDYENKELVIIDDGTEKIGDMVPPGIPFRYFRLERKHSVGEKRNIACSHARGEVIVHWDDDDWRGPQWISLQVRHLLTGNAHVTGLDQPYFYDPFKDKTWQYIYPADDGRGREPWVHGGTLCYWKSFWETNRFLDIDVGEDLEFLWSGRSKRVVPHRGIYAYVAMIHHNNVSPKHTWDKRFHERHSSYVRKFMGDDFIPYRAAMENYRFAGELDEKGVNAEIIPCGAPYQMEIKDRETEWKDQIKTYFQQNPQTIPKIIHQVWIGPKPPPWEWIDTFRKDFMQHHPDWEYRFWTEKEIGTLNLINREQYEAAEDYQGKVDILRYELLYRYGGIYIDADSRWLNLKPFEPLLEETNETGIFAGREDDSMSANGVIGASLNNPVMYYLIKLLPLSFRENRQKRNLPSWISTGPRFFSEVVKGFGITVFPTHYFYPVSWHGDTRSVDVSQFPDSYMMQYGYTTNAM